MSSPGPPGPPPDPPPSGADLQFEKAEFTSPSTGLACSNCAASALSEYHEFAGKVYCSTCRQRIEQSLDRMRARGNLMRAFLYGLVAAAIGSALFYAIAALTGFQFGLIAVVVGYLVGRAVRKGSGALGGRRYQVLAVLLTYASISSTHVPGIVRYFYDQKTKAEAVAAEANAKPGTPRVTPNVAHVGYVRFFALVFVLALALPFLALPRGILGLVIIGIGLWQAWKLTRAIKVEFKGPFTVAPPSSAASA